MPAKRPNSGQTRRVATLSATGRSTPTGSVGRPTFSKLTDPEWLAANYEQHGDQWIADRLGCDRKTVRSARRYHGIASQPRGPRPSYSRLTITVPHNREVPEPIRLIRERFIDETAAPTEQILATRLVNLHHARGNRSDYRQALIDLGSACALLLERHLAA